jgi:hypothetical protein
MILGFAIVAATAHDPVMALLIVAPLTCLGYFVGIPVAAVRDGPRQVSWRVAAGAFQSLVLAAVVTSLLANPCGTCVLSPAFLLEPVIVAWLVSRRRG